MVAKIATSLVGAIAALTLWLVGSWFIVSCFDTPETSLRKRLYADTFRLQILACFIAIAIVLGLTVARTTNWGGWLFWLSAYGAYSVSSIHSRVE